MSKRERVIQAIDLLSGLLAGARETLDDCEDDAPDVALYADWLERLRAASAESRLAKVLERQAMRN